MDEWWFLSSDGNRVGPLTFERLQAQARAGGVGPTDLVWNPSWSEWEQAIGVKYLFPVSEFERVLSTYSELIALRRSGRVGEPEFREAVARLRLTDSTGVWWQVRAEDGAWLRWDGNAWVEGMPEAGGAETPGGPYGMAAGGPRSLGELGLRLLRGLGRSLPKKVAFTVALFALVWLVHTAVMVFFNDGWAKVGSWFLGMILVLRGGELGGTFFWMLLTMLVTVLLSRLRGKGARKFGEDIAGVPRTVSWAFARPGRWGFGVMFGLAALTLLISFLVFAIGTPYTPNRLVSLFFAVLLLLSLSSGESSFVLLVSRLAWMDFQRLFGVKPIRAFQPAKVVLAVVGIAGGALLAAVLPFLPTSGWFGVLALLVAGAIMTALGGRGAPVGGVMLMGFMVSTATALLIADQALAHDWGWQESGRDIGRLIQSPGFGRAAAHSITAAIGAVLGALLPGVVGGVTGGTEAATPSVSPPPPTRILEGEDALGWLKQQGLVTQTPEGGWVKTGDWGNATAPGSGMKGYVEGSQSTPGGVDTDMIILVEAEAGPPTVPAGPDSDESSTYPPDGDEDVDAEMAEPEGPGPGETHEPPERGPVEPETAADHGESQESAGSDQHDTSAGPDDVDTPVGPETAESPTGPQDGEAPLQPEDSVPTGAVPPAAPASGKVSGSDAQEGTEQGPAAGIPKPGSALHGPPSENPHTAYEGGRTGCTPGRPGLPSFFVNTATLNLVIQDTMYRWSGLGPIVDLTLTYNSGGATERGSFGFGWSFAYEWRVVRFGSTVIVWKGSGQCEEFGVPDGPGDAAEALKLTPAAGCAGRLVNCGDHWEYTRKGSRLQYRFDHVPGTPAARLTRIVDSHGEALVLDYDEAGRMRALVDAAGRTVSFRYDATGCCTGFSLPDGREASFGYDENGDLVRTADLLGVVCEYTYDSDHCATQMVVGRERRTTAFDYVATSGEKRIGCVTDARGHRTRYELEVTDPTQVNVIRPGGQSTLYTSRHGLTERVTDPLGNYEEAVFRDGLLVAHRNKNGEVTEADYDEVGNVVEVRGAAGGVARYRYDADSNLVGMVGPRGERWTFAYNDHRDLSAITSPLQTGIAFTYDASGRLTALSDSSGRTSALSYDRFGNVERATDPLGHTTVFSYDEWGMRLASSTDALGRTTRFEYDENDRPVRVQHPDGASQSHVYDCCAPILSLDENGSSAAYERDPLLNITRFIDRGGNHTDYSYDTENKVVEIAEGPDRRTRFAYDAVGRLVSMTDAMDRKTVFAYDPAGNLVLLGDPAGRETRFDYAPGGALASITDCRGNTMSMQWDVAGRPARVINARGGETSFVHDAEGHVVAKSYDGMELATYEYDAAGNLQRMTDPTGVIVHTCDARGLPSSTVHPDGTEIQYTHDPNGNVSSITYPGGLTVTYEYDERNRVRHVRFGAAAVGLLYDRAGHLTAETRSNGCATAYRYDEGMFFREIAHARGQDSLAKIEQRRNAFGDIVEEAVSGMYRSYLLDEQTSVSHNELDQIIERDGRRYQYDEDGNLLAISDGSMSAEYDQENRLLSIEIHGTKTLYDYNGVGDRVAITQGDERLHLHHDVFGRLLFETDPSRMIRNRYVYAANRLVAVVNDRDEIFFYHADSRGSAILLTDEAGEVAVSYAYSPLGSVTVDARREVRNPFTYVGTYGVTDEGGGLYFMKNRFYDSATGGFLQRDPLWFAAGTNLYAYAKGNPLSYVDPSGLAAINDMSMMLGLSNFMGGLVGGMVAIVGGGLILGGSVIAGPGLLLGGGLYAASRLAVGFRQVDAAMRGEAVCNENSGYSIARSSFLGGIPFVKSVTYAVELNGKGVAWEVGKLLMGDYGAVLDAAEDVTDLNLIPEECVPAISGGTVTIP